MEDKNNNLDFTKVFDILKKYPNKQQYTLPMLQDIQNEYNYIPRSALEMVSDYLDIKLSKLYSIATFYKALSLKPKGKYIIKVCDGTACHIRGSETILKEIEKILKIGPGQTTEDGLFSLETVGCLGSCALAPVMVINEKYYGKLDPNKINKILSEYGSVEKYDQ